ncbi:Ba157.6 [Baboon cytomegalovirus]|nr:Ba157.6 [Baboon cytomegalovirus]
MGVRCVCICVYICICVRVVLCGAVGVDDFCSELYANFTPYDRPDSYWDVCSKPISDARQKEFLERIVNASITYHYDMSHGYDNVGALQRINVTEVSLLVNAFQDLMPQIAKSLNVEFKTRYPQYTTGKNGKVVTWKVPSYRNIVSRNLISFGASASSIFWRRNLFLSIRLPIKKQ